jgi:hypothetical protein
MSFVRVYITECKAKVLKKNKTGWLSKSCVIQLLLDSGSHPVEPGTDHFKSIIIKFLRASQMLRPYTCRTATALAVFHQTPTTRL